MIAAPALVVTALPALAQDSRSGPPSPHSAQGAEDLGPKPPRPATSTPPPQRSRTPSGPAPASPPPPSTAAPTAPWEPPQDGAVAWTRLACSQSHVALEHQGDCAIRMVGRGTNGFQEFYFQYSDAIVRARWWLQRPASPRRLFWIASVSARDLRTFVGGLATRWGTYRGFADTGYMEFSAGPLHCVAVDHAGQSYSWRLRGSICQSSPIADAERFVKATLGTIRIGPLPSQQRAIDQFALPLRP